MLTSRHGAGEVQAGEVRGGNGSDETEEKHQGEGQGLEIPAFAKKSGALLHPGLQGVGGKAGARPHRATDGGEGRRGLFLGNAFAQAPGCVTDPEPSRGGGFRESRVKPPVPSARTPTTVGRRHRRGGAC
jgi:hypothetical protein